MPPPGELRRKAMARVELRPARPESQVSIRYPRDAAPAPPDRLEYLPELLLSASVPPSRDATRKAVRHTPFTALDELEQLEDPRKDVERLEASNAHGNLLSSDEVLEDPPAGDRRGVARGEEALDPSSRHLRDDLHHRRDVLVGRQDREVLRGIRENDRSRRNGGGFEAGRKEDHLLTRSAREIGGLGCAVDDVDPGPFAPGIGQRLLAARNAEHVSVGCDPVACFGEEDGLVDLGRIRHANGTARAHDQCDSGWQGVAQTESRNGLLVTSAHVHHANRIRFPVGANPLDRRGELRRFRGISEPKHSLGSGSVIETHGLGSPPLLRSPRARPRT